MELPPAEELTRAFAWLEGSGFGQTSRLPLFAARHWSPAMELRARARYRQGLCNFEEVAVPRWYWAGLQSSIRALFGSLTLGFSAAGRQPAELACLMQAQGAARWRVVRRFSRYVLHSPAEVTDDGMVYFGDDTLFLMHGARELLARLARPVRVLDLCCGGGGVGLALPRFEGELVGVDVNPVAVSLATLAAAAQGLKSYFYVCGDMALAWQGTYDLVVGNPPTLPPELGGRHTLYATGDSARLLDMLERLLAILSAPGRALLTVFSRADGTGEKAFDPLRAALPSVLGKRPWRYTVRRQFPLGTGQWLRHVALELGPSTEGKNPDPPERFVDATRGGFQLPGLAWRRANSL
jgi:SAM-dependent methyltransferase